MRDELAKSVVDFENRNELTDRGTLSCMVYRLCRAVERYNELYATQLKITLGIERGKDGKN
jgi:hypothetical protein